jgi:hypothetical protein
MSAQDTRSERKGLSRSQIVLICGIPVTAVAIFMLVLLSRETPSEVPPNQAQGTHQDSDLTTQDYQLKLRRDATLRYWHNLGVATERLNHMPQPDNDETWQIARQVCDNISNLDSLNVDQRALDFGAVVTKNLREITDTGSYLSSAQFLADCYTQGSQNGDVVWGIRKGAELRAAIQQKADELKEQKTSTRQALTQVYGVEFE